MIRINEKDDYDLFCSQAGHAARKAKHVKAPTAIDEIEDTETKLSEVYKQAFMMKHEALVLAIASPSERGFSHV